MALDISLTPKDITKAIDGSEKIDKLLEGLRPSKSAKDEKNLQEIFDKLHDTLSDEMKSLYEKCMGMNDKLRKESNEMYNKISEATTNFLGGKGKDNDKVEKSSKDKPKPSDLLKLDKNFSMGYLLLHTDLEKIQKDIDKAVKAMTGNKKINVLEKGKNAASKAKEIKPDNIIAKFSKTLADFGPAIKNLLTLNVLKKPLMAGLKSFLGIVDEYAKKCEDFQNRNIVLPMQIVSESIEKMIDSIAKFTRASFGLIIIKVLSKPAKAGIDAMTEMINTFITKVVNTYGNKSTFTKFEKMKATISEFALCVWAFVPVVLGASLVALFAPFAFLGIFAMMGIFALTKVLAKLAGNSLKDLVKMAAAGVLMGVGFLAMAGALWVLSKIEIDWKKMFITLGFMLLLVGMAIGIGALFMIPYVMGAVTMFGIGGILMGASFSMMSVAIIALGKAGETIQEVGFKALLTTLGFMGIMITSVALLTPAIAVGLPGAVALLPFALCFSGGMGAFILGFMALAELNKKVNEIGGIKQSLKTFGLISAIALGMAALSPIMVAAMVGAVAFMPFALSFSVGMGLMNLGILALGGVSKKIEEAGGFKNVLKTLGTIGLIAAEYALLAVVIVPAVIGATLMMPFALLFSGGMALMSLGFNQIAKVNKSVTEAGGIKQVLGILGSIGLVVTAYAALAIPIAIANVSALMMLPFAENFATGLKNMESGVASLVNIGKLGTTKEINDSVASVKSVAKGYAAIADEAKWVSISALRLGPFFSLFGGQMESLYTGMNMFMKVGEMTAGKDIVTMAGQVKSAMKTILDTFNKDDSLEEPNGIVGFFKSLGGIAKNALLAWKNKSQASLVESVAILVGSIGSVFDVIDDIKDRTNVGPDVQKFTGVMNQALDLIYNSLSLGHIPNKNAESMNNAATMMGAMADIVADFTAMTNINIPEPKVFHQVDDYIDDIIYYILGYNKDTAIAEWKTKGKRGTKPTHGTGVLGLAEEIAKSKGDMDKFESFANGFGSFVDGIAKISDLSSSLKASSISTIGATLDSFSELPSKVAPIVGGMDSLKNYDSTGLLVKLKDCLTTISEISEIKFNSATNAIKVVDDLNTLSVNSSGLKVLGDDLERISNSITKLTIKKNKDALMALNNLSDKGIDIRVSVDNGKDVQAILGILHSFKGGKGDGIYVNNMVSIPNAEEEIIADSVESERDGYKQLESASKKRR